MQASGSVGEIRERASTRVRLALWAAVVTVAVVTAAMMTACSATPRHQAQTRTTRAAEDLVMAADDFRPLQSMTTVRGFFVDNRIGHLADVLRVANSPNGGTYPVGTIIQLVPQEAMVKRRPGFNPATHDWEFFSLKVSASGTEILRRGGADVVNQFGGSCAGCHSAADARFDMVCEHDHGCAPLPISDAVIAAVQRADPRPPRP